MQNPVTTVLWYMGAIFATMLCPVPVVTFASLVVAVVLTLIQAGPDTVVSSLKWQLSLLVLIVIVNPLFASVGSTTLFELGSYRLTLESALYGLVMGCMLMATLLWFSALFRAVTQDEIVDMVSTASPGIGLMLGMVMRFVGRSVSRIGFQAKLDKANSACSKADDRNILGEGLDTLTMLLGFVLDRALTQGEYMKALGWGLKPRSSYRSFSFSRTDIVDTIVFAVVAVCAIVAGSLLVGYFSFYPVVTYPAEIALLGRIVVPLASLYVPVLVLIVAPLVRTMGEEYAWAHR
jgi:energy-coupling factor transport system permease protein